MNKIVRTWPASALPQEVRDLFGADAQVKVTIEPVEAQAETPVDGRSWWERNKHIRRDYFKSAEEIDAYIAELRDEWSHRER